MANRKPLRAVGQPKSRRLGNRRFRKRSGAATLDYILVLCFILPVGAFVIGMGGRIMQLVYEMLAVFLAWPFM